MPQHPLAIDEFRHEDHVHLHALAQQAQHVQDGAVQHVVGLVRGGDQQFGHLHQQVVVVVAQVVDVFHAPGCSKPPGRCL